MYRQRMHWLTATTVQPSRLHDGEGSWNRIAIRDFTTRINGRVVGLRYQARVFLGSADPCRPAVAGKPANRAEHIFHAAETLPHRVWLRSSLSPVDIYDPWTINVDLLNLRRAVRGGRDVLCGEYDDDRG